MADSKPLSGSELPTLLNHSVIMPSCTNVDHKKLETFVNQGDGQDGEAEHGGESLFLASISNSWSHWLSSIQAITACKKDPHVSSMVSFEQTFQISMKDYVNATAMELVFEDKLSSGQSYNGVLDDYMKYRVDASGVFLFFDFAMLFGGVPMVHWQDEEWQRLRWLAGALVAVDNDIISYHKDDSIDYVKLQMLVADCSEADALSATKQYHHSLISEYNEVADKLHHRYHGDESIAFWVDTVFPVWFKGGFLWQCEARRYKLQDKAIIQELFPDFVFPVVNPEARNSIAQEAKEWGMSCGLLTDAPAANDPRYPAKHWDRLEIGLGVLRVYAYADISHHENKQILAAIAKFLGWIFVVDDVLEVKARHEGMKKTALACIETLTSHLSNDLQSSLLCQANEGKD